MGYTPLGFISYVLAFPLPLSVLFTWVYNNTKGNLFLMILFHAVSDSAPFTILATRNTCIVPVLYISLNRGVVTLVVVRAGAARLSRSVALAEAR
jgi:membrane protease YdiL (CAAX protease family)